jgi:Outer membrane lipoprotein-sorting protein
MFEALAFALGLALVAPTTPALAPTPPAAASAKGADPSPEELSAWLQGVDDARTAFGEAKITARATQTQDGKSEGVADFDVYIKGRDKALVIFRGGKNDGRKALTVGQKMWLIVPGAENPVPVSANQRLMGGASFGDVARMRFAEDYAASLRPGTETVAGHVCRVVELTATSPKTPYPRITLWLDAGGEHLPRKLLFFLSSGKEAREVQFTRFTTIRGKTAVSEMEIRDRIGPNSKSVTRLEYLDIQPAKIDDAIFTPEGAKAM